MKRSQCLLHVKLCAFAAALAFCVTAPAGHAQTAPQLFISSSGPDKIAITWPAAATGFVLEETSTLGAAVKWQLVPGVPVQQANQFLLTFSATDAPRFFRLRQTHVPLQISRHLPLDGAGDVGVTFRPQVFFSQPINPATLTSNNFFATAAGAPLAARIVPANDGSFAWLFFQQPLPGGTRVQMSVDGTAILSADGASALDADGDGQPGGVRQFEFTTVSRVALPGTSLSGIVVDPGPDLQPRTFDDLDPGGDLQVGTADDQWLLPLAGVKVYLLGREEEVMVTGADGRFHFGSVPVGDVKVVVNGTTALNPPAGVYFPEMVLDVDAQAGVDNWVMRGDPAVYLPRLAKTILQTVDTQTTTLVTTKPEGASGLTDAQRQQLTVEVPPDSLIAADGTRLTSGQVGISTVPPELVRDMLPPGVLQHTFDITVQAPGIATFATPAPVTSPNIFNAPPGTKLNFLSFDHTTGRLVIEGTGTVSADGLTIRTDPGTGVTHPGWHGWPPPGGPAGPDGPPAVCEIDLGANDLGTSSIKVVGDLQTQSLASQAPPISFKALPMIYGEAGLLSDPGLTWKAPTGSDVCGLKVKIEIDGPLQAFMKKTGNLALTNQTFTLRSGSAKVKTFSAVAKTYDELAGKGAITNFLRDVLFGTKVTVTSTLIKSTGAPDAQVRVYYLYRWINVTYPPDFLSGRGNTAAFRKTLNDGTGNWSTIKVVGAVLPQSTATLFSVAKPAGTPQVFDVSTPLKNGQLQWEFDPPSAAIFSQTLTLLAADGHNTVVGTLNLLGRGVDPARINLNLDGYKSELKRIITSLRNVSFGANPIFTIPIYVYNANAPGLAQAVNRGQYQNSSGVMVPADFLNFVPGGATNVSGGYNCTLGDADDFGFNRFVPTGGDFENIFAGFMPSNRIVFGADGIVGSPDDSFSSAQLDALDVVAGVEANKLFGEVVSKFSLVNFLYTGVEILTNGPGADVNIRWIDCLDTGCSSPGGGTPGYGPTSPGWPVFGWGQYGRSHAAIGAALGNNRLPLGAKFWELAEDLNVAANGQISVGPALRLDNSGVASFAAVNANTVAHEIGHTLGLLDAYTRDGKAGTAYCDSIGNCMPRDIMRTGSAMDPPLNFAPGNVWHLRACVGIAGTLFNKLTISKKETFPPRALDMARRTYNLATSSIGIQEVAPPNPPPTYPEIKVLRDEDDFMGLDGEQMEIEGEVAADGPSGELLDVPLTILNPGYGPLTITSVGFSSGNKGFSVVNAASIPGQPIISGGSATFTVRFDPVASGATLDTLLLASDAPNLPLLRIPITANAFADVPTVRVELAGNNNFGGIALGAGSETVSNVFRVSNGGKQPLQITSIALVEGAGEFSLAGVPANLASQPVQLAYRQDFSFGGSFQPNQTGLRRAVIEIKINDPQTPAVRVTFVGTGVKSPMTAEWGDDFVAIETPDLPAGVLRAKSDSKGNFEFFMPAQEFYHLVIFDQATGLIGHETDTTQSSGQRTVLVDTMVFMGSIEPDSDYDGLPDDVEFAIGSNPNKADSDGDGIEDFASVVRGIDPLGGRALPIGIAGQLRLVGNAGEDAEAKQVVVITPGGDLKKPIALVAAGSNGLAVIDVQKPTQPVLLNQLRLDGNALDVGADADLGIAVVAAGDAGLHTIDISNPASPRLIRSLCSWKAEHVEVVQGIAYVVGGLDSSGYSLAAFDLTTGQVLQTIPLPGIPTSPVTHEGTMLYLITGRFNLQLVDIGERNMKLRNSITVGAPDVRSALQSLAVGNGIAYLTLSGFAPSLGGYATVDVANPDALKLIAGTSVPLTNQAPGLAMALNGSGVGVLIGTLPAGFQNFPVLDVMDVSDPTNTFSFIRRIDLPSAPSDVTIHQGLAYVACGTNGLVIVNYLPFDAEGKPPTVSISTTVADADPAKAGRQVLEGGAVPVRADVRDDVQVERVELMVNGQVVQTSAAVPFDLLAIAPPASVNGGQFSIQVRATDTGGNVGLSGQIVLESIQDPRVLAVERLDPASKHIIPTDYGVIDVAFTKPILPGAATFENFSVLNSQGQKMALRGLEWAEQGRLVRMRWDEFPPDNYTLVLRSANIRDFSGNALGQANLTNRFTTHPFTMRWTGAAGPTLITSGIRMPYSWSNPQNWCPVRVPGSNDSVFINLPRTNTFTRQLFTTTTNIIVSWVGKLDRNNAAQPAELRCLVSNEEVGLHNVDLRVREFIQVNNYLDIAGSALRDTLVIEGTNNILSNYTPYPNPGLTADGYRSLLDRVTLQGDFQVECTPFDVINRLTILGNVRERKNQFGNICIGNFSIDRDTVIEGPGTLHDLGLFITIPSIGADPFATQRLVTINTNVTFRGHFGMTVGTGSKLINRGRFLFDELTPSDVQTGAFNPATYFSQIWLAGYTNSVDSFQTFINEGTIEISNGYRLGISGTFDVFVNRGTLRVRDTGRLLIFSPFISPKTVCDPGGLCSIGALITDPGQVSEFSGGGRWFAEDQVFRGGTVRMTEGAVLEGAVKFNSVTFEGELHNYDWTTSRRKVVTELLRGYSPDIQVTSNLTLNGLIYFHRQPNENRSYLLFRPGVQRLQGTGRIEMEGATYSSQIGQLPLALQNSQLLYLHIGQGITIHAASLTFGFITDVSPPDQRPPFVENFGTILTQPGDYLYLSTFGFTNSGVLHIASNNVVATYRDLTQTPSGKLEFDVAGTVPGTNHGRLKIAGKAELDGSLQLQAIAPFQFKAGDHFDLVSFTSRTSAFNSVIAQLLAAGLDIATNYSVTNFSLDIKAQGPPPGTGQ